MVRIVAILGLWIALAMSVFAHDPGISTGQGTLHADGLDVTFGFAPADAQQLISNGGEISNKWTEQDFESAKARLESLALELYDVRSGDAVVPPSVTEVRLEAADTVNFRFLYPRAPGRSLTLRGLKLSALPAGHRQFVIIADEQGSTIAKKLLSANDAAMEIGAVNTPATAEQDETTTSLGFVRLGIEHIWTGYDHLLFLFALLVVCRTFRSIVAIITCFTLAHSITLALATLDVVNLPARLVEPAIAASIVYVGVENLLRRGEEPRGRSALTFAFGLVHGFGFATVLRDLGVGGATQGIAMPLFTFNLGVEIGQVVIAAVVLPIVWRLRRREGFARRGVPALSALVAAAGLYWLVERTVLA